MIELFGNKSYSDVVKGLVKSGYILEKKFDEICWLFCGKLLVFICAYVNLYHRDYDAMHVVAHALKYANGFKHSNIQATRINAFDYLNQLNIYENGVTGRIFFTNREVLRPLAVGVFKNQKLISALSQYQLLSVETNPITVLKQILEGQTINVNDTLMSKMN